MFLTRAWVALSVLLMLWTGSAYAEGFQVVFEDDFEGTQLDPRKWATRYVFEDGTLSTLTDELQNYADKGNHVMEDGVLSLVARAKSDGSGRFESGMLRSRRTFYYGYFETRVMLPTARGTWPAFWLNSDYDGNGRLNWPPEIDAFEFVINGATETPDMLHSSVKVGKTGAQGGRWIFRDSAFNEKWAFFKGTNPLNRDWQVIGLLWTKDEVSMYLNGKKLYTREYHWVYNDGQIAGPAHVLLNLAVGGAWAGSNGVDTGSFPQALKVDYVRVCQLVRAAEAAEKCGGSRFSPSARDAGGPQPGDLARTKLIAAELSRRSMAPGESLAIKYAFEAVPTSNDHPLHTWLVDSRGQLLVELAALPPVRTSQWQGTQNAQHSLIVPSSAKPGVYRVLVGLGSGRSGALSSGKVPLDGGDRFGVADGKLRLTVGHVTVEPPKQ